MKILVFASTLLSLAFVTSSAADNTLTSEENAAGWKLLFDGKSLAGWRGYAKSPGPDGIGSGWKIQNGTLRKQAGVKGGDLITESAFGDFELSWEWRLAKGANNGVKYLVTEKRPQAPGLEYQMIDDADPKWEKLGAKHSTASLYDILPPANDKRVKPAGDWNHSRIVLQGNQVEHWLNGNKVLTYELGSPALKQAIAQSKFKAHPDFGQKIRGHIMLTDHQDEAWFRNIKIRPIGSSGQ